MGFGNYKNEKGHSNFNDDKVDSERFEFPEKPQSFALERQDEPDCKTDTEKSMDQPKKYTFFFGDWVSILWFFVNYDSFWYTRPATEEERRARKEILARLKVQLEEPGKREETIRLIHTIWSDYLSSAKQAMAFPTWLIVLSVSFFSVWLIRREFSNQNRRANSRSFEFMFLLASVIFSVLTYLARSIALDSIEEDIVTFILRGEW